jgi:hypothetical protein
VLAFISDHHVGPDIEIELFMLTPDDTAEPNDAPLLYQGPSRASYTLAAPREKLDCLPS